MAIILVKTLGSNIKKYREAKDMTLQELVDAAQRLSTHEHMKKLTVDSLRDTEEGKWYPYTIVMACIAKALGITDEQLLEGDTMATAMELLKQLGVADSLQGVSDYCDTCPRT